MTCENFQAERTLWSNQFYRLWNWFGVNVCFYFGTPTFDGSWMWGLLWYFPATTNTNWLSSHLNCVSAPTDVPNLVELDLSHNFLREVPVDALSGLKNLKFLNLGSNRIEVRLCHPISLSLPLMCLASFWNILQSCRILPFPATC